jgi:hypothetical protein
MALMRGAAMGAAGGAVAGGMVEGVGFARGHGKAVCAVAGLERVGISEADLDLLSLSQGKKLVAIEEAIQNGALGRAKTEFYALAAGMDDGLAQRMEQKLFDEERLRSVRKSVGGTEGPDEVHGEFLDDLHGNRSLEQEYSLEKVDGKKAEIWRKYDQFPELIDAIEVSADDWARLERVLAIGRFESAAALRTAFESLDDASLDTLEEILSSNFLESLSGLMRGRYLELREHLLAGKLENIQGKATLLDEVLSIRKSLGKIDGIQERLEIGKRNVAFGDYQIELPNGQIIGDEFVAWSGKGTSKVVAEKVGNRLDDRTIAPEITKPRNYVAENPKNIHDSEGKVFESILKKIKAKSGISVDPNGVYPEIIGKITVKTEMTPCDTCFGIMRRQFENMFPGIKVEIQYGIIYEKDTYFVKTFIQL